MIVSRAPLRVSLFGGGSDLPWYFCEYGDGAVFSLAIDRYVSIIGGLNFDEANYLLKYSSVERVQRVEEIQHPIVREVTSYFDLPPIDVAIHGDVPAGTGLGSSSSFTCAMIRFAAKVQKIEMTAEAVAQLATWIEIERLGEQIGKQDQYASALGGLNLIEFSKSQVKVSPSPWGDAERMELQSRLRLVYLGLPPRSASEQIANQIKSVDANPQAITSITRLADLARQAFSLPAARLDDFGPMLKEAWALKKESSPSASNARIDELLELGLRAGATGAKLLGAGGAGFIAFFVPSDTGHLFDSRLTEQGLKILRIRIESVGARAKDSDEWL